MPNKDKQFTITVSEELMEQMKELSKHSGKNANEIFPQTEKYVTPKKEKKNTPVKIKRERLEATIEFSEKE